MGVDHEAQNIKWLEFELSNNCQYANDHKWCPRSKDNRGLVFLQTKIVHKVVDFFKQYDFHGIVYLSGYSEPLIDPRLTELVRYIKANLQKCKILMFSNGIACDENLLGDIITAGVDKIMLSAYTPEESIRLTRIVRDIPQASVWPRMSMRGDGHDIDERIKAYDPNTIGIGGPCFMPSLYYFVRNNGEVNMCFWDWKYTQVFGNLYWHSVAETLTCKHRLHINNELVNGNRSVAPVCNQCRLPSDRCTREYLGELKL